MGIKLKLPKLNKKNFPYQLVICYWEDTVSDASWLDIVDIKKEQNLIKILESDFTNLSKSNRINKIAREKLGLEKTNSYQIKKLSDFYVNKI